MRLHCARTPTSEAHHAPDRRVMFGTLSARKTPSTAVSSAFVAVVRRRANCTSAALAGCRFPRWLRSARLIPKDEQTTSHTSSRSTPCTGRDFRRRSRRGSLRTIALRWGSDRPPAGSRPTMSGRSVLWRPTCRRRGTQRRPRLRRSNGSPGCSWSARPSPWTRRAKRKMKFTSGIEADDGRISVPFEGATRFISSGSDSGPWT